MIKLCKLFSLILITSFIIYSCDSGDQSSVDFEVVTIGKQIWMAQNLAVDTFQNGDLIPEVQTAAEWEKAGENKQAAWCYYGNDPENGKKHGKLYNWYAVADPRGLAPDGWHIPTDAEWTTLTKYLGGEELAGKKMKTTEGWMEGKNGTNESGFSGSPSGRRTSDGSFENGTIGEIGNWWSTTLYNDYAWHRSLYYSAESVDRYANNPADGMSLRFLKD